MISMKILCTGSPKLGWRGLMLTVLAMSCSALFPAVAQGWSVSSPNGQLQISVRLAETGSSAKPQLSYRVEHGLEGSRATVIKDSPLGLLLQGLDFGAGLKFERAQPQKPITDSYIQPHGKRRQCQNQGNQLTVAFRNAKGVPMELDLRAYNNGVAFRYRLPGGASGRQTLESELTGFGLPPDAKLWCAPSDKASTYSPAYETYYENEMPVGTPSPLGVGWSFPCLFRTADSRHWALITEANVETNFCGTRLSNTALDGVYTITLPNPAEGNGQGSSHPSSNLPWEMPWRVIIIGDSLGTIAESTLVTDVSTPSQLQDTSWIRPGRVAWSWWSDNPSPKSATKQRQFVDLAAEMGWEYVLVDANWTIMEDGNIHDVLRYAKSKGIGVLLWYNSGGPHNVVTEKPRDCFTYAPVRQFEFNLLREWGIKGVKIDFFQSDKQDVIGLYHGIMEDAAKQQIMVNFHGCTLPRGWERTYPHLMSMEAVRGEECYIFDPKYPEAAPVQNTILPFTRNAVGPMDYTPVGFSNNTYPHKTTWTHELGLSVLFETGWLHFTDKAEAYRKLPAPVKQFLKEVPVTWDDTRFVDGYPGKYAVLARSHNQVWRIAGVNGQNQPREMLVKPGAWLGSGPYELTLINDGAGAEHFETKTQAFDSATGFSVQMQPFGGFVAVLKPAK